MERLKTIKNQLISEVQVQMSNSKCVDTRELGEVIDMIKDIAQTEYYCEIYKQMKESEGKSHYKPDVYGGYEEEPYYDKDFVLEHMHDKNEGKSHIRRKMYMESKHSNDGNATKELEGYMQDLTADMVELMEQASPEEKAMVQKKVNTLANKMQNM